LTALNRRGVDMTKFDPSQTERARLRMSAAFPFGIEEEYFLVDAETKLVAHDVSRAFFGAASVATQGRISPEFLQPQIEVKSSPHVSMTDARSELRELRHTVSAVAAQHGLAILAAGTHPTALWRTAQQTPKKRYDMVMHDLQMIGQRDLLCGLHVHVELPDPDERVDVMYRMLPYLPLFLALSTSSPFWQGRRTGLKGYRLAAYDELPRTGVPELFRTREEFDAYVAALVRAGVIEDSSFIWWAIRPSLINPTLELRAPDTCTMLEDALAIAALYRTIARYLCINRWRNADLDAVQRALVIENKWRAQRYGVHGTFVTEKGAVPVAEMLEQVINDTAADAAALGCTAEIDRCRAIVGSGTSADVQLAVFEAHSASESRDAALRAVTDWIAAATLQ
jgi:glutamate---cysteine ligase / carboxylate-amine ligase